MKKQWCELGDLADVSIGFKSLQNQFFYLDVDTIKRYGIEEEFLRPIVRMKDFKTDQYFQKAMPSQFFFHCTESLADIKGTGALKYIRVMAGYPAKQKKQSGKPKTISQALKVQGGIYWYAPKAKLHEEHIWLRKAFDSIYAPFLLKKAMAVDQRCNYVRQKGKISWETLAGLLSSSLFGLSVEAAGAASMGAGALEVPTTMLRNIRLPDIRLFSGKDIKILVELGKNVWKSSRPFNWGLSNNPDQYMKKLDKWLLQKMGSPVKLEKIYEDLKSTYKTRKRLAADKITTVKSSESHNVESAAETIVSAIRPILEGRRFPESFFPTTSESISFDFSGHTKLVVRCDPFLSNSSVILSEPESGKLLFEEEYPRAVAEIIIRALMMARRKFRCPKDSALANSVLSEFHKWMKGITGRIMQYCRESTLGTRFESRLFETTMRRLGLHTKIGEIEVFGEFVLDHDLASIM